jgi:hypothetical protein
MMLLYSIAPPDFLSFVIRQPRGLISPLLGRESVNLQAVRLARVRYAPINFMMGQFRRSPRS